SRHNTTLYIHSLPTRRSSDLLGATIVISKSGGNMDVKNTSSRMIFTFDLRLVVVVLLLVIVAMFAVWQPWVPKGGDGTIQVTGQDRTSTRLNSSHEWTSYAGF